MSATGPIRETGKGGLREGKPPARGHPATSRKGFRTLTPQHCFKLTGARLMASLHQRTLQELDELLCLQTPLPLLWGLLGSQPHGALSRGFLCSVHALCKRFLLDSSRRQDVSQQAWLSPNKTLFVDSEIRSSLAFSRVTKFFFSLLFNHLKCVSTGRLSGSPG